MRKIKEIKNHRSHSKRSDVINSFHVAHQSGVNNAQHWNGNVGDDVGYCQSQNFPVHHLSVKRWEILARIFLESRFYSATQALDILIFLIHFEAK